jgi:hypothetical protein
MTHPLQSYFYESKDGHMPDEVAREDITGLVNDPDLVREVCAIFHESNNIDTTCYAIGKVYDVCGESYGCVSILSEDVANIIGEPLPDLQEQINFTLISTFLEFRRVCNGSAEIFDAWDGYLTRSWQKASCRSTRTACVPGSFTTTASTRLNCPLLCSSSTSSTMRYIANI